MRILVTGAQGQVGLSLAETAAARGVELLAVGRADLDITRKSSVDAGMLAHKPDVVVNAAAYTAVDKAESEPDKAHLVNATGAGNVAEACRAAGVPIIHISTDFIFDGMKAAPYSESEAPLPLSVYGCTKLAGEKAVAAGCPSHLILRTAWVHSPFGHNFVKTMLRLAEIRDEIGVVDDQVGSPTFAPHLAEAILSVAERVAGDNPQRMPWGVYHVADGGETSWCGLARAVFDHSKARGGPYSCVKAIATADYPTPARRPSNSRLACDKFERVSGIVLPHWTSGVEDCVARILQGEKEPANAMEGER